MRLNILLFLIIGSVLIFENDAFKESVIHTKLRTTKNIQVLKATDLKNEFDINGDLDDEENLEDELDVEINNANNYNNEEESDDEENSETSEEESDNEENSETSEEETDDEENNDDEESNNNNDDDEEEEETDVKENSDMEEEETDDESSPSQDHVNNEEQVTIKDPCKDIVCGKGEECISVQGVGSCRCRLSCPPPASDDDKLCALNNETYPSLCELHRTRCLYLRDKVKGAKRLRLRYYGPCKALPKCHRQEYSDFPLRMRSWIKNVYLQLYDEGEVEGGLPDKLRNPGRRLAANRERLFEFEQGSFEGMERNMVQYRSLYRLPVYWKFVSLDQDPSDGFLSKTELESLMATLIPLEPCTRAFFKKADLDKDRRISMQEWGAALHMDKDDMDVSEIL